MAIEVGEVFHGHPSDYFGNLAEMAALWQAICSPLGAMENQGCTILNTCLVIEKGQEQCIDFTDGF
jgi:hypothetical protein